MTTKHIRIMVCDRCGLEYDFSPWTKTIGHLEWMVLTNGSGSSRSDDSKDLCDDCTQSFLAFMRGER